jgi:hypothetical protein
LNTAEQLQQIEVEQEVYQQKGDNGEQQNPHVEGELENQPDKIDSNDNPCNNEEYESENNLEEETLYTTKD